MSYLLDVNVLIAWGWSDHPHHERVDRWIQRNLKNSKALLCTTSIAELGFVRVSVQKSAETITIKEAVDRLEHLLCKLETHHRFLTDDLSSRRPFPAWCKNPKHTTDAHLPALAESLPDTTPFTILRKRGFKPLLHIPLPFAPIRVH